MSIIEILVVVVGLMVFEVVSSIDNAVINAEVLATTNAKARRWFLTWGLLSSVVVIRGVLPLAIVFAAEPSLGIWGAITAAFSSDPSVIAAVEESTPILLAGGGIYLLLLFVHWLMIEPKNYAFGIEKRVHHGRLIGFYILASILTAAVAGIIGAHNHAAAISVLIGACAFFLTAGIKSSAETAEADLVNSKAASAWRKIVYLELIDTAFSIDGVLGAFAFTTAVPLILAGNGLGVLVVRQITIRGVSAIRTYKYLANGAMYSIALLAVVMLVDGYGVETPFWVSPVLTVATVGYFWQRSRLARTESRELRPQNPGV